MTNTNKKLVYGIGYNDLTIKGNEEAYSKWKDMLGRCYSLIYQSKQPTYIGCSVCDEWLTFSKFKEWFSANNRLGMQLDKDILIRGNKIYGPEYCRFVPRQINTLLLDRGAKRGVYKLGVSWDKGAQKFRAQINRGKGSEFIGYYNTELEAFNAYKIEKELWIKNRADWYYSIGLIGLDIHTALYNWII
jgi:hypothetical protein